MNRNYTYSDEILFEYAGTMSTHLETDLAAFTAFDPDLSQAVHDQLNTLLHESLTEGGDDLKRGTLGDQTETVLQEMKASRLLFNQLRYWAVKAFPARKAVQRQFGVGRFRKVSSSQPRMVEFMHELAQCVEQYRTELEGAGAPEALLDQASTQARLLMNANQAQESLKGNRTVDTEARITRLNALFDILRRFNNAAEFVFFEEPARRELYRSPGSSQPVEEELEEAS